MKIDSTTISLISIGISIASFIFVLYDRFWSQKAHIKCHQIVQTDLNSENCCILLVTITNNSTFPVGIFNIELNGKTACRQNRVYEARRNSDGSEKILKEYSVFPINIAPKTTVDVLLDFSPSKLTSDKKNELICYLSRYPSKKR